MKIGRWIIGCASWRFARAWTFSHGIKSRVVRCGWLRFTRAVGALPTRIDTLVVEGGTYIISPRQCIGTLDIRDGSVLHLPSKDWGVR